MQVTELWAQGGLAGGNPKSRKRAGLEWVDSVLQVPRPEVLMFAGLLSTGWIP